MTKVRSFTRVRFTGTNLEGRGHVDVGRYLHGSRVKWPYQKCTCKNFLKLRLDRTFSKNIKQEHSFVLIERKQLSSDLFVN